MKDLLSHMISGIIGKPADVMQESQDGFTVFQVSIPKDQIGIIIGRGGKTINAIKNVLKIRAIKEGARVDIQVNEA